MSDEVDFICGCPTKGCTNTREDIRWKHATCHTYEKINDEGMVKCLKNNCLDCPIVCLQFKCGHHDDYKDFDPQTAFRIVGQLSSLDLSGKGKKFLRNLRKAVDRQLDEYEL